MTLSIGLCDTEFWNNTATWSTNSPQLTPCFRDTILVWLPAAILALTITSVQKTICRCLYYGHQTSENQRGSDVASRILITTLIIILKLIYSISTLAYAIYGVHDPQALVPVHRKLVASSILAPIIQLACYSLLARIYHKQRNSGYLESACIWFYLLLSLACELIDFHSMVYSNQLPVIHDNLERSIRYTCFPLTLILFLLECQGNRTTTTSQYNGMTKPEPPRLQANFISRVSFWYCNELLLYGYRNKLTLGDMWRLELENTTNYLANAFQTCWHNFRQDPKVGPKFLRRRSSTATSYETGSGERRPSNNIIWVLIKLAWPAFIAGLSCRICLDFLQLSIPLLLKLLLRFMASEEEEPRWHGILFVLLMLAATSIQSIFNHHCGHITLLMGIRLRGMINGSVYRKALRLSGNSRLKSTGGEMINLMAIDSLKFYQLLWYLLNIIMIPLNIALVVVLLYNELGWSAMAGLVLILITIPASLCITKAIRAGAAKMMALKDIRSKQTNELLMGIKVIKLYAWEPSFRARINGLRNDELRQLLRLLILDGLMEFFWICNPVLISLVTFAVYVSVDEANTLDAEKAFVGIGLFNMLKQPLVNLPSSIAQLMSITVSCDRLNKFLNNDELVKYVTREREHEAISIEGGTLAWSNEPEARPVLVDIDLHVRPQSFVAIVGQVASGKSSLLASILGELYRISGRFNICQDLRPAYVAQQAWIQNMSLRDNILFGEAYDEQRYQQVLDACSLRQDLEILPGGDMAEIGEQGINLSGGQKQRVSLARAFYSRADILLLDDPLSALDAHVAKWVFEKALASGSGLVGDRTRVLATNSLFVLPHVDHIVVLREGRIAESGTYEELMRRPGSYLAECMSQYTSDDAQPDEGGATRAKTAATDNESRRLVAAPEVLVTSKVGKLTDDEKMEMGSVDFRVYWCYLRAVSKPWIGMIMLAFLGTVCFNAATNIWLSIWSSDNGDDPTLRSQRLAVYASLGGAQCALMLAGSIGVAFGAIRASRVLSSDLLETIIHSPMSFFDTTPVGRIINRFSRDVDAVDMDITDILKSWAVGILQVLCALAVICYTFPLLLLIILPLAPAFYMIQKLILATTRQLKRLESITVSPIYSHFSETLQGLSSIRAYQCQARFVDQSDAHVDNNLGCSYPILVTTRWLAIRLEFFGALVTTVVGLFSVYNKGQVDVALVGLAMTYSISISQMLCWIIRWNTELEKNIVSVERIVEYIEDNKQEDSWSKAWSRPDENWPSEGVIQLENYSTRYREDTDLVLRDLNFRVESKEKIGIVGRTGCGKSSLSLALLRILEPVSGRILIDGQDLTQFGLHDVRSRLTIIPQDPVLFSGSVRFNLDPLGRHEDLEIWRSLELAHLKAHIGSLPAGLDHQVSEYGENFSVGQRQLICLARAILRKSKILILDEATASVDHETDAILQRMIREIFTDCTILTIAHRLHTILDSDRILVLDGGQVRELDSARALVRNPSSEFASLLRDAGMDDKSIAERFV